MKRGFHHYASFVAVGEPPHDPRTRNVRRPDRAALPVEVVRDLLGICRALYRAERGRTPVGAQRLRELEAIGRELRTPSAWRSGRRIPTRSGTAQRWTAPSAPRRLLALVDQPIAPALRATKVVR